MSRHLVQYCIPLILINQEIRFFPRKKHPTKVFEGVEKTQERGGELGFPFLNNFIF